MKRFSIKLPEIYQLIMVSGVLSLLIFGEDQNKLDRLIEEWNKVENQMVV